MSLLHIDRRTLIKSMLATAGCFAASASAIAQAPRLQPKAAPDPRYRFPQGVASGDPQPDLVVLWTRVEDSDRPGAPVKLTLQLARAEHFAEVILEHSVTATAESNHTLRFIVEGLSPDTIYFYRFVAGQDVSRIGRTRTAPDAKSDRAVNFAFASCQSYEQGFYGAWARMIADDKAAPPDRQLDFVLFLGDFIYEVRGDRPEAEMLSDPKWLVGRDGRPREIPPFPDGSEPWPPSDWNEHGGATHAVTLADYRHLYKLYLTDPHLQEARARWPFVSTWDDHEFTNDCWQAFATYPVAGPTAAQRRKVAANQAWFEFMPALLSGARPVGAVAQAAQNFRAVQVEDVPSVPSPDDWSPAYKDTRTALASMTIYRALRWGRHCQLVLTDTRSYRSPPAWTDDLKESIGSNLAPVALMRTLDEGRAANGNNPPASFEGKTGPVANPRQASPPGTMLGAVQKQWFKDVLKASDATWKIWGNSTPAVAMRVDASNIPFIEAVDLVFGTDGWGGYPGELRELMSYLRQEGITNVISCAGDYHIHAAGTIMTDPGATPPEPAAVEFAAAGISSTPVYTLLELATRNGSSFRQLVTVGEGEAMENNWDRTMVAGCYSAIIYARTGLGWLADWFWNRAANPGLGYFDSNACGYGLVRLGATEAQGTLVTIANVTSDPGNEPPLAKSSVSFRVEAWRKGEGPELIAL